VKRNKLYNEMNNKKKNHSFDSEKWWLLAGITLSIFMLAWQLGHLGSAARSWDEVDFALALNRYDLLAMQPHFPGYPYFILGGMLLQRLGIPDPVRALSTLNVIMTALSIIPLYLIARRRWSPSMSLWLALMVTTPAYIWVLSAVPMSEATAIGILWWYIWSIDRGMEQVGWTRQYVLPLLLFSILMGVRVSFAPFGVGLLLLSLRDRRQFPTRFPRRVAGAVILGAFFQLVWIGGLISSEGSVTGFIVMAKGFVSGHFKDWGGTVATSTDPFLIRIVKLAGDNLIWTGWLVHSKLLAVFYGIILIVFLRISRTYNGIKNVDAKGLPRDRLIVGLCTMLILYFLWVLFGQNIDKPRHITPLIGGMALLLSWWILKRLPKRAALAMLLIVTLTQSAFGCFWVEKQSTEQPAIYQMAQLLSQRTDHFTLYTWEETRLLQYMNVKFSHQRVLTYNLFLDQLHAAEGEKILLTDHVLEGFEKQVGSLSDKVRLIADFRSEPLFDPVYSHIRLYEWIGP
jgi:hypothetical protein